MMKRAALVVFGCLFGSCSSVDTDAPSGSGEQPAASVGRGIVSVSDAASASGKQWPRPEWRVGDRFTLVRGERMKGTFAVTSIVDGAYVLDMGGGSEIRRDRDLGNLGHWRQGKDGPERSMSPADVRYHWPLWLGKQWTCEYIDRTRDGRELRMIASYEVEEMDRVTVPAGTFDALRIRRSLRMADAPEEQPTTAQMIWYAPDAGLEVRQLLGDSMVELVEFERGPR